MRLHRHLPLALALVASLVALGTGIRGRATVVTAYDSAQPGAGANTATAEEFAARCGTACHVLPHPDILPRTAWRDELVRMMLIMEGVPEPSGAMRVHSPAARLDSPAALLRSECP